MLSVANKPNMLSVIMLNVVKLSVVAPLTHGEIILPEAVAEVELDEERGLIFPKLTFFRKKMFKNFFFRRRKREKKFLFEMEIFFFFRAHLPVKIKQNAKRFEILSKKKNVFTFFCLDEEEEKDPEKLIENRWKKVFPPKLLRWEVVVVVVAAVADSESSKSNFIDLLNFLRRYHVRSFKRSS
jgi:hypothetical protein